MNREEAFAFCELLFGDEIIAAEGLQIEVASITPGKRGRLGYTFCKTTAAVADTAMKIAERGDNAYVCMSLVDPKTIKKKRGTAKDAKGIVGFWADIDIADPLTPKPGKNPPVSQDEAVGIACATGSQPSIIVQTGHGIHAYWLFDKPWIFEDEADRNFAADLAKSWEVTLHQVARDRGRSLDSVGDLARVLRIPGTINSKVEVVPIPTRIIWPLSPDLWMTAKKRSRGFYESLMRAPVAGQTDDVVVPLKLHNVEFRLPDDLETAKINHKIVVACMNSPQFKETWEHRRKDFASSKNSASEYDMSLACQLMASSWDEQDIYWAMLLCRQLHGDDMEKLLKRADYVELTIAKAKKGNVVAVSLQQIAEISAVVDQITEKHPETPEQHREVEDKLEEQRPQAFAAVSGTLGSEITGFHRDGTTSGSIYYLDFWDIRVNCGTIKELFDVNTLRCNLFEQANIMMRPLKTPQWMEAIRLLGKFLTEDKNPYLDPSYRWLSYLVSYVEPAARINKNDEDRNQEDDTDDVEAKEAYYNCINKKKPFVLNGQEEPLVWFSLEAFRGHVLKVYTENAKLTEMTAALRRLGAYPRRRTAHLPGRKRVDKFLWCIPEALMLELVAKTNVTTQNVQQYTKNVANDSK